MTALTIEIPVPDGTAEAYVAGPEDSSAPGVLFFMDAYGLRPQIADMLDRIAGWGYTVLAPNVFHRHGSVADLVDDRDHAMERVRALTPDHLAADAPAYLSALRERCADGGIGTTGYCMGARLAVRTATAHPDQVAAVGGFHGGGLATDDPDSPHLGIPQARAEFVFGHADHDRSMPPEAVGRLGEALSAAGLLFINDVYAGAPHGYTMNDTPAYHEESAERHYRALESLLGRTPGVTGPQEVAESAAAAMWAGDRASQALGMEIVEVGPGRAVVRMTVREDMVNGHAIGHGGLTFTLADSAFAFACNSYDRRTVAAGAEIRFRAPTHLGDVLTATATERSREGRSGVYDVEVTGSGTGGATVVATFVGHSREIGGSFA